MTMALLARIEPILSQQTYLTVLACVLTLTVLFVLRGRREPEYAAAIKKDIRIKQLFIHPIKSCRGSAVTEAHFDEGGLQYDRSWLIIDAVSRRFQTARELPKMVTITPRIDLANKTLFINVPLQEKGKGSTTVSTPLDPTQGQLAKMELLDNIFIWGDYVNGYAVSKDADDALSEFFDRPVRLVRKGPSLRNAGPDDPRGEKSSMHYQDFYPILLASDASINHVRDVLVSSVYPNMESNKHRDYPDGHPAAVRAYRVSDKVSHERWPPEELETLPIQRFRPNIVVESFNDEGGKDAHKALVPWEEDGWTHVEVFDGRSQAADGRPIGYGPKLKGKGTSIDCVARCGRCMVPNVDPESGLRDNYIPYTVMQRFRQVQPEYAKIGKPCFGVLSCPAQKSGTVRVGDLVRITHVTDPATRKMTK